MTSKQLNIVLGIIIVVLAGVIAYISLDFNKARPTSYEECTSMGGVIQESHPSVCRYKNLSFTQNTTEPPAVQPADTQVDTSLKTYTNTEYGFSFQYPSEIKVTEKNDKVILTHTIPFKHSGCDLSGEGKIYTTLNDFNMSFELVAKNINPAYTDGQYTAGQLKGVWAYEGAEGCGPYKYYFPVSGNRTLLVTTEPPQILSGVITSEAQKEVLKVPGVISKEKSNMIFTQILTSFKFTK